MPIYAYRCTRCGHELDTLQKISEPALVDCPACGAAALAKQVTAAGFQLKGSGWYQTDFRSGSKPAAKEPAKDRARRPGRDREGGVDVRDVRQPRDPFQGRRRARRVRAGRLVHGLRVRLLLPLTRPR